MKKYKVAFMSTALSVAAVAVLVQCAPKTKDKDDAKKGTAMAAVVDGMDFSALEKAEGTTSTKTLLQSLKDGKAANDNTLAMAIIEMHVKAEEKADAKTADIQTKVDAVQERILKLAESSKAQKMEELKKSYKAIEEEKKGLRYVPGATSIVNALNGEIQEYSGTNLLALLWLKTAGLNHAKAVVLLEEGQLKLAEIRADKKIFSIDSTSKCAVSKDESTTDELAKAGQKKKLIPLDLFLVHEALKPYVSDSKAWALKIQAQANKSLGLKIAEKDLTAVAAEKTKINQSSLFIGELKSKASAATEMEDCSAPATTEAGGKKEGDPAVNGTGDNQAQGDKAGDAGAVPAAIPGGSSASASTTAQSISGSDDQTNGEKNTDNAGPGFVGVQSECLTVETFKKQLPTVNDNKLFSLFAAIVRKQPNFLTNSKASIVMTRLESEKEHIDLTALASLDLDFTKIAKEALKEAEGKKLRLVVVVKPSGDKHLAAIWTFDKEKGTYVDVYAPTKSGVSINEKAVAYLKSKAKATDREKDTHLIVEMKTQDGCLK